MEITFAGKTNDFEDELNAKASAMGFDIVYDYFYYNFY